MAAIARAHARLEGREIAGKLVLTW
jgi:hypothetical protein